MKALDLTVLMYHYVRDAGDRAEAGSGIPGLPVAEFVAQLDFLAQHYTFVAWPAVRACLLGGAPLPPRACLLTFDDGVLDHYLNVTPLLHARGVSGLFFALAREPGDGLALAHRIHFLLARLGLGGLRQAVWQRLNESQQERLLKAEAGYGAWFRSEQDGFKTALQRDLSAEAGPILSCLVAEHVGDEAEIAREYYLGPSQIAEMRATGMHFGGHSRDHVWFDWVSAEQQGEEIRRSAEWLRAVEPGPWPLAYPYGGFNSHSPHLLQAGGFAAAFTTRAQAEHVDPFFIGRLDGESLAADLKAVSAAATYGGFSSSGLNRN
jgi:peptidoglycan/xylan/chitin deacetylase (PgdA/CDA1 family)